MRSSLFPAKIGLFMACKWCNTKKESIKTVIDLAELLGVTIVQLRNYQNGKTVTPHADTLNTMAKNFRDRIDGGGVLTVDMLINDEVSVVQFCGALTNQSVI